MRSAASRSCLPVPPCWASSMPRVPSSSPSGLPPPPPPPRCPPVHVATRAQAFLWHQVKADHAYLYFHAGQPTCNSALIQVCPAPSPLPSPTPNCLSRVHEGKCKQTCSWHLVKAHHGNCTCILRNQHIKWHQRSGPEMTSLAICSSLSQLGLAGTHGQARHWLLW